MTVPSYINAHNANRNYTVMVRGEGEVEYSVGLKGHDAYTTASAFCARYGNYWVDKVDGDTIYSTYR